MDKYTPQYRTGFFRSLRIVMAIAVLSGVSSIAYGQHQEMIIRISEIEIHPQHLEEYKAILKHEAEASVRLEEGVIAIFPMFQKENPAEVRILEMYRDQQAYQAHLKTEHFLTYKSTTLHMVKSLKLVDMTAMDLDAAAQIFIKLKK